MRRPLAGPSVADPSVGALEQQVRRSAGIVEVGNLVRREQAYDGHPPRAPGCGQDRQSRRGSHRRRSRRRRSHDCRGHEGIKLKSFRRQGRVEPECFRQLRRSRLLLRTHVCYTTIGFRCRHVPKPWKGLHFQPFNPPSFVATWSVRRQQRSSRKKRSTMLRNPRESQTTGEAQAGPGLTCLCSLSGRPPSRPDINEKEIFMSRGRPGSWPTSQRELHEPTLAGLRCRGDL